MDQNVLARIHLEAVLSNLEIMVQSDPKTAELAKKWTGTINFMTGLTGPRSFLRFRHGQIKHVPGKVSIFGILLFFPTKKLLNNMFTGKGIGFPVPLKGFLRMRGLLLFKKIAQRMEEILKGDSAPAGLKAKLLLNTIGKTVAVIASHDNEGKELAKKTKGVAEIRIKDNYAMHVDFSNGKVKARNGNSVNPDMIFEFCNNRVFLDLTADKLDVMAAIGLEEIVIFGNLGLADKVGLYLNKVGDYLS